VAKGLSQELRDALDPLFGEIESLSERIAEYDRRIEQMAKEVYPQVTLLKQVKGVGTLIAFRNNSAGLTCIGVGRDHSKWRGCTGSPSLSKMGLLFMTKGRC
jgi:hypothetical protein